MHNLDFLTNRELILHVDWSTASDLERLLAERLCDLEEALDTSPGAVCQKLAECIMRMLEE